MSYGEHAGELRNLCYITELFMVCVFYKTDFIGGYNLHHAIYTAECRYKMKPSVVQPYNYYE